MGVCGIHTVRNVRPRRPPCHRFPLHEWQLPPGGWGEAKRTLMAVLDPQPHALEMDTARTVVAAQERIRILEEGGGGGGTAAGRAPPGRKVCAITKGAPADGIRVPVSLASAGHAHWGASGREAGQVAPQAPCRAMASVGCMATTVPPAHPRRMPHTRYAPQPG